MHHDAPTDLRGAILYHCGPVMLKVDNTWRANAAGPTTSIREEPYEADIIKRFGLRAVMGKGGMGTKTLAALKVRRCICTPSAARRGSARAAFQRRTVYLLKNSACLAMWVFGRGFPYRHHGRPREFAARGRQRGDSVN
jgi:tartrate dehydratase beta subunit/fumarate hydratase class I family protein